MFEGLDMGLGTLDTMDDTIRDEESTVFIIDDDSSIRRSLKKLIKSVGLKVETFALASDFLAREPFDGPCCIVVDIRMPGMTGFDLQEALNSANSKTPVIFLTAHGDIGLSVRAMKAGAEDFIEKPFQDQIILDAVHTAIRKSRQAKERENEDGAIRRRIESLSSREYQVLTQIINGKSNRQVALALGVAEGTIKVHRSKMMKKMQADSLAALIRMVERIQFSERRGL